MKVIANLLIANIKTTVRNRQALFWNLVFPLMFIVIFGLFNFEGGGTVKIAVSDEAKTVMSQTIVDSIKKISLFKIHSEGESENSIKEAVKKGDADAGVIIPVEIKNLENPQTLPQEPIKLKVYYDSKNIQTNSVVLGTLNQFVTQMNLSLAKAPIVLGIADIPIDTKKIKYIEFILTGILGMAVMQSGIIGISVSLSHLRETDVLKKIMTTPLLLRHFAIAFILNFLLVGIAQTTILLTASHLLFKTQIYGSLLLIYFLSTLGTLVFLCFGFIVAAIAKTTQAAEGLSQLVSMPMMFLSGVFFSTEMLPAFAKNLVQYLPLTPLITALRKVALDGGSSHDVKIQIIYLLIWLVATFVIAISVFRFSENKD